MTSTTAFGLLALTQLTLRALALPAASDTVMVNLPGPNNMCGGIEDTSEKVYYGACTSAATFTRGHLPYFTSEVVGAALITGSDKEYLSNQAKVTSIDGITGTDNTMAEIESDHARVEQVIAVGTGTLAGSNIGDVSDPRSSATQSISGMLGSAYYLVTSNTPITANYNTFPCYEGDEPVVGGKVAEPNCTVAACIVPTANGACGAAKSFSPGELKFSLFGWAGGTGYATALTGKSYLGFRTQVDFETPGSTDPVDLTFNAGIAAADFLNSSHSSFGSDITSFSLTFKNETLIHNFVATYNLGNVLNSTQLGTKKYQVTDAPGHLSTRAIKIKASYANGNDLSAGIFLDYLFTVAPSTTGGTDGLDQPGRYFVYDPSVTATSSTTPPPPPVVGVPKGASANRAAFSMIAIVVAIMTMLQ